MPRVHYLKPSKRYKSRSWEIYWKWNNRRYAISPGYSQEEDDLLVEAELRQIAAALASPAPVFPDKHARSSVVIRCLADRYGAQPPNGELRDPKNWLSDYVREIRAECAGRWAEWSIKAIERLEKDAGSLGSVSPDQASAHKASQLILGGDNNGVGETYFNKSQDGKENDLYIGNNAEFNLFVDDYVVFNSGIDGEDTSTGSVLNLRPLMSSYARSYASVYLINNTSDAAQIFHTGTTNVESNEDKSLVLYLTRGRIDENDIRVTFRNDNAFNLLNQHTLLSADGTVQARQKITVTGAGLYPHAMSRYGGKNSPARFYCKHRRSR